MDTLTHIAKDGGVLALVYKDLAQPGVRQVGKALETALQLGSSLLLPLRLTNEAVKRFEERKFKEIAHRFSKIPDEKLIDVSPEIGVPILEALSITQDSSLRAMFIELLAKSATASEVHLAHPNFVNFISALSPDEAKMLLQINDMIPFINYRYKSNNGPNGILTRKFRGMIFDHFSEFLYPGNINIYIENLFGLGLLSVFKDSWIAKEEIYENLYQRFRHTIGFDDSFVDEGLTLTLGYDKGFINLTELGKAFVNAVS
jgi:hypothetical protein